MLKKFVASNESLKFLKNLIEWMIPFRILGSSLDIIRDVMKMLRGETNKSTAIAMMGLSVVVVFTFSWLMRNLWRNIGKLMALISEEREAYFKQLGSLRVYRPVPTIVATLVLAATCLSTLDALPALYIAYGGLLIDLAGEYVCVGLMLAGMLLVFVPNERSRD